MVKKADRLKGVYIWTSSSVWPSASYILSLSSASSFVKMSMMIIDCYEDCMSDTCKILSTTPGYIVSAQ